MPWPSPSWSGRTSPVATEAKAPAHDHPWRRPQPRVIGIRLSLVDSPWSEDNYDLMELEAFVEKRS